MTRGITAPKGFQAAGFYSGVKRKRKDLSMMISQSPMSWAALFTTNVVKAAPVLWGESLLKAGKPLQALVINSGNANACTGEQGDLDLQKMVEQTAMVLSIPETSVLIASTGVIGVPLPIEKILSGIPQAANLLDSSQEADDAVAEGIVTTDTFIKQASITIEVQGVEVTLGGMAKGSGMIHPNMATMLAFVTTDAKVDTGLLQELLKEASDESYHMISVDGDTSTNDTVAVFANGESGVEITKESDGYLAFKAAFFQIHQSLAIAIVSDGEGAGKLIEVKLKGAATKEAAKRMARSIVSSSLVKTAFFGEDANWGRILCAMGYSGADFNPKEVGIQIQSEQGLIDLMKRGVPIIFDEDLAAKILSEDKLQVLVTIQDGKESATAWGCDLSYEYVKINGEYRT
jgi:glutamate N-acetyltransferase/amino-acid N-acetyltransferase